MAQLPKPFQRPSIALGTPAREWMEIPANQIRPGDTVPDVGVISDTEVLRTHSPSGYLFRVYGISGVERDYRLSDYALGDWPTVFAFVIPR